MSRRGALLFAGLCVLWGIPYLLIKVAVVELHPVVLVSARTVIAAVLLLPLAALRGVIRPVLPHWRPLLAFALAETLVPWGLLSDAERHLTSSLTGLLVAGVPLVGTLLALLQRDGERLSRSGLAGLGIGMAGVAALVGVDWQGSQATAVAEMVVVVVGYACGPAVLTRWLADVPGLGVIALTVTLTALVYTPVALFLLPDRMPSARVSAAVLVLGAVCTAAAFLMLFGAVAELGPVRATMFAYVNPAVAVLAGVLLLDEPFTTTTASGFALVVLGSVLATRGRRHVATPRAALVGDPR
jgi:drug/metabolite transporter (DMT)-like permease